MSPSSRPRRRAARCLAAGALVASLAAFGIVPAAAAESDSAFGIVDDVFVRSTTPKTNYGSAENLIIGKGGHAYFRIDIADLDLDETDVFELDLTKYNNAADIVVTRADEHLTRDGTSTDAAWTTRNVTYDTRPADVADSPTIEASVPTGEAELALDLRELARDAQDDGEDTLSLHITTAAVDDLTVAGTDLYSTRSAKAMKTPWLRTESAETATVQYPVETRFDDYYADGAAAQKIVRIRSGERYVAVADDGSLTLADERDDATAFALYGFDYTASDDDGSGGAQHTTYALKSLSNDRFLTIQNYDGPKGRAYYDADGGTYRVTASAVEPQWNERFDVRLFEASGDVEVRTHLDSLRDEGEPVTAPVRFGQDGAVATAGDRETHRLTFEETSEPLLEVQQRVSGDVVRLSWRPVAGDDDPLHYAVSDAEVQFENGLLAAEVDGLEPGRRTISVEYTGAGRPVSDDVEVHVFAHPAVSVSAEQLGAMREHVRAHEEPWYSDYLRLKNTVPNGMASLDFEFTPRPGVGRGNPEGSGHIADYEQSSAAAYFDALQWVITGDDRYAEKTTEILNAWSHTLTRIDGRDQILGAGLSTVKLINAAEIVKHYDGGYDGYSDADFADFQQLMLDVVYPVVQDAGAPMIANGNWDQAAIAAVAAIGVVTDHAPIFDRAMDMYRSPFINGSIENYVSEWGQSAESARDQAHAQLGIGLLGDIAAIAANQGVDLWSIDDDKLARAFNWAAEYNLFRGEGELRAEPIPNIFGRTDASAYWTDIDSQRINRGQLRPIYEVALAHYSHVPGVDTTWMARAASAMRPEGLVHFDNLNFATLTSYNGEAMPETAPVFQLRTMLTPWWQTTWSEVETAGDIDAVDRALTPGGVIPEGLDEETLPSYFSVQDDGRVEVDSEQDDAPYFQLVTNDDESYSIRDVRSGRYLGVTEEIVDDENVIDATATRIGADEKFKIVSWGVGRFYLLHDGRAVRIDAEGADDPLGATLSLRLSEERPQANTDTAAENWFAFSYGRSIDASPVEITTTTRCTAGKVVLVVAGENVGAQKEKAHLETPYGAKLFVLQPGERGSFAFTTRQASTSGATLHLDLESGLAFDVAVSSADCR